MSRIALLGGTGFLGRHVADRLAQRQHQLVIPTRNRERAKADTIVLPTADVVLADLHDDAALERVLAGCDAVVNLVGILHSRPGRPWGPDFERAHVALPRRVAAACTRLGIPRLIQVSALGAAADAPSEYLRSKAAGEAAVMAAHPAPQVTVFRPSVVFGPDDRFLNLFALLQRWVPLLFLARPEARFQPVFVEDVAAAIAAGLDDVSSFGRAFALAGPRVYTLRELVRFAGERSGHPRPVIGLGRTLSLLQAWSLEFLPVKLMSRDNIRSMDLPNVSSEPFPFGIRPTPLESVVPAYLGPAAMHSRYDRLRHYAARR